jgi:integrase
VVRYKARGKTVSETVGWLSQGVNPQFCNKLRAQIVHNIRQGEGFQSLKEKRELEESRKQEEKQKKAAEKQKNTPFDVLAQKYIEWAKDEKKSWKDDDSRYHIHIAPEIGNIPIKDVSKIHLEQLKASLKKKNLADATIKHVFVLIRQMYNQGIGWGYHVGANPVTQTIKQNRKFIKNSDNKRVRFLSREEADKLLKELKSRSPQLHDICQLSLLSGMRMGEIFNLKWQDVDLTHDIIHIKDPKSGLSRNAYITKPLKKMFQGMKAGKPKASDLVFKNGNGEKIREISNVFDRAATKLGFNEGVTDRRDKVVAHTLRHTFASWLAMAGEPIITIQRLMGHSNLDMTLRYAHLSPSHEREAATRLAQLTQPPQTSPDVKLRKD